MQLKTERLHLRPVTEQDLEDLFRIYGDPATNTFNPAGPYPDIGHAKNVLAKWLQHWSEYEFGHWAITEKDPHLRVIGFGGISIRNYGAITMNNLGYRFATEAWGKGYATELSRCLVEHGFNKLDLQEISATVRAHHLASQNVLKKSGLRFIRDIHDVENAVPSMLFSLTRKEWLDK